MLLDESILQSKKLSDLRAIAKIVGVEDPAHLGKTDILDRLRELQEEDERRGETPAAPKKAFAAPRRPTRETEGYPPAKSAGVLIDIGELAGARTRRTVGR